MNTKLAIALFVLPVGMLSVFAKTASAAEEPSHSNANPVLVADRYDDTNRDRRDDNQRDQLRRDQLRQAASRRDQLRQDELRRDQLRQAALRRDELRRNEARRVWIPGHWESGFLGIGRHWVEGHWENRG